MEEPYDPNGELMKDKRYGIGLKEALDYNDWRVGVVYDSEHDRNGWRTACKLAEQERDELRRKVAKCNEVLSFTKGYLDAIEADSGLAETRYGAGAIRALTVVITDLENALEDSDGS